MFSLFSSFQPKLPQTPYLLEITHSLIKIFSRSGRIHILTTHKRVVNFMSLKAEYSILKHVVLAPS